MGGFFLGVILDFNSWGFQFFGTIFGGLIFFQCVVMDYYQYYGTVERL